MPPHLITWISKNPHPANDNLPNEDYRKTLIWSRPPKAIIGHIIVGKDGSVTFTGQFSTPRSPDGKDGGDLDDTEMENFLALLHDEINDVEDFAAELANRLFKSPRFYLSSLLPTTLNVTVPITLSAGRQGVFRASATRSWGTPLRTARFEWRLSDGRRFTGAAVEPLFKKPGSYSVTVTVRDRYGARATTTRELRVVPAE